MAGVAGAASRICLSFISPGGTQTDKTLPTGSGTTTLDTRDEHGSRIQATLVDLANPAVHVDGRALGLDSSTTPPDLDKLHPKMALLEKIRREGAEKMGLDPDVASVPKIVPLGCWIVTSFSASTLFASIEGIVPSILHAAPRFNARVSGIALCVWPIERTKHCICMPFEAASAVGDKSITINVGVKFKGKEVESAKLYSTARLLMLGAVNVQA